MALDCRKRLELHQRSAKIMCKKMSKEPETYCGDPPYVPSPLVREMEAELAVVKSRIVELRARCHSF